MKHFINILVLLILTGFAVGLFFATRTSAEDKNVWPILYVPILAMMFLWGTKLFKDY